MATNSGGLSVAFALSFAGGLIILFVGIVGLLWFSLGGTGWGMFGGWMSGMMGGNHGFMSGFGGLYGLYAVISGLSVFSGAVIIAGAFMLRVRAQDHLMWGIVILIFSIVSLVGMGGFFIGALLGIIGGSFALAYRPWSGSTEVQLVQR